VWNRNKNCSPGTLWSLTLKKHRYQTVCFIEPYDQTFWVKDMNDLTDLRNFWRLTVTITSLATAWTAFLLFLPLDKVIENLLVFVTWVELLFIKSVDCIKASSFRWRSRSVDRLSQCKSGLEYVLNGTAHDRHETIEVENATLSLTSSKQNRIFTVELTSRESCASSSRFLGVKM